MKEVNPHECFFCANPDQKIDFKDVDLLKHFLSSNLKVRPQKRSGLCSKHQRKISSAIKKARKAALLQYSTHQ